MCGILGIVDNKLLDGASLRMMRDTMKHRGPDDAGIWINETGTVGLAHRRLSIIDLSEAGRQPMSDASETIWITYNGEIYNFLSIRNELIDKGYRFRSNADSEVIIYAYKEWGHKCIEKFNGMFAFGLYDENLQALFLARDRLGKKPLYYHLDPSKGRFAFASEIKALLRAPFISKEVDIRALNYYLTVGCVPYDLSIFKSVKKLMPAGAMLYDCNTGEVKLWNYWDIPKQENTNMPENDLLDELETLIEDAVNLRMISDVPLGAFLSGGIDSSLVVAMMSRVSDKPVKTFSIGFEKNAFNELPYAKIIADHFGTDHHEMIVKPEAFTILPDLVRQFDEPFADSSMIPTYYVSKATREHVTVALSGDGGDEMFGGYERYAWAALDRYMSIFPRVLRSGVSSAAEYLPENIKGKRMMLRLKDDPYDAFIDRLCNIHFMKRLRGALLNDEVAAVLGDGIYEPENVLRSLMIQRADDVITNLTFGDVKMYLPDDIMVKVDRTSMLVSLETRAPFLDYRIAEFSFRNIPGKFKVKGLTTKYLLKSLARKVLPENLKIDRKWGFVLPIADWFRGPLSSQIREILLGGRCIYFKRDNIGKLLDEHSRGINRSGQLFTLLVFFLWQQEVA